MNQSDAIGLSAFELQVEHRFATHNGVRIHYASAGNGPLVVLLHGFPDYWMTWRHQIAALSPTYRIAALDMRGYNLSDKPAGMENYAVEHLMDDVAAVIADHGEQNAIIIGHDWGGVTAWNLAMQRPAMVNRLIVLNVPHPWNLARELTHNPQQHANSQYARDFQNPMTHTKVPIERLSQWVSEPAARELHQQAMLRSDLKAMLHYYQANYPRAPYQEREGEPPLIQVPTLFLYGLADAYLLADGLNGTWKWTASDLTITTIPGAGHFVQQDAAELVSRSILMWLSR